MATLEPTVERRAYDVPVFKRTAWGAVFAGTFVAIGTMLVLATLGLAIGASTIDVVEGESPSARAFGIGAGVWWLITGIAGLLVGGWTAGRLAGMRRRWEGPIHGVVTWALTGLFTVALLTNLVGGVLAGAMGLVGGTVRAAGQAGDVYGQVFPEREAPDLQAMREDLQQQLEDPELREQARQRAMTAADQAARAVSIAAWWSFFYLLLTAGAAALGGWLGSPHLRRAEVTREPTVKTDPVVPPQPPPPRA